MKIAKLLLIAVLVTTFVSCNNDDDNNPPPQNNADLILGNWTGTGVDYSGTTVTEFLGQTITADFVGESFDHNYTLEVTENPNELTSGGTYSIELTTTIEGQSVTETVTGLTFLETGTWSIDGDQITVTANGETNTATIEELTETTLRISATQTEDLSQQGATITTTVTAVGTYTRQ